MSEETSREGLRDGRGCRCVNGEEDDESGEKSTGDEATLRRAPLSVPTTSGDVPQAATLQPERATQRQHKA
uniref:Uncharacterized protein n=1 Tax=Oryza glumipatula TaxID=40148 RepID=A0A0E0B575_9ORYZ